MAPGTALLRRSATRFIKAREGSAAVEFALIAAPFFFLLMAILEVALFFFASAIVENATAEAARDIRTGRLQNAGQTQVDFTAAVCERVSVVADCDRLRVDVRTFDDFGATDFSDPIDEDGELDESGFGFDPGSPGDVVVVRVFYDWQLFAPGAVSGMSNLSSNRRLISAATAFRTEPFEE